MPFPCANMRTEAEAGNVCSRLANIQSATSVTTNMGVEAQTVVAKCLLVAPGCMGKRRGGFRHLSRVQMQIKCFRGDSGAGMVSRLYCVKYCAHSLVDFSIGGVNAVVIVGSETHKPPQLNNLTRSARIEMHAARYNVAGSQLSTNPFSTLKHHEPVTAHAALCSAVISPFSFFFFGFSRRASSIGIKVHCRAAHRCSKPLAVNARTHKLQHNISVCPAHVSASALSTQARSH